MPDTLFCRLLFYLFNLIMYLGGHTMSTQEDLPFLRAAEYSVV